MAMLRNIVSSLIEHQQIMTTYAKAKAAQRFADKMVTLAKKGTQRQWDMANAFLFVSRLACSLLEVQNLNTIRD